MEYNKKLIYSLSRVLPYSEPRKAFHSYTFRLSRDEVQGLNIDTFTTEMKFVLIQNGFVKARDFYSSKDGT